MKQIEFITLMFKDAAGNICLSVSEKFFPQMPLSHLIDRFPHYSLESVEFDENGQLNSIYKPLN